MASDVPTLSIVTPSNKELPPEKAVQVKKSDSCHIDLQNFKKSPQERKKEETEWLQKNNIAQYYNYILDGILERQPAEPLAWFMTELHRAESMQEALKAGSSDHPLDHLKQIAVSSDSHQDYLHDHGIFGVFEELVQAALRERPNDPVQYTIAWIRFNGRHVEDAARDAPLSASDSAAAPAATAEGGGS